MKTPSFSIRRVWWAVRTSGRTHPFSRGRVWETVPRLRDSQNTEGEMPPSLARGEGCREAPRPSPGLSRSHREDPDPLQDSSVPLMPKPGPANGARILSCPSQDLPTEPGSPHAQDHEPAPSPGLSRKLQPTLQDRHHYWICNPVYKLLGDGQVVTLYVS